MRHHINGGDVPTILHSKRIAVLMQAEGMNRVQLGFF